MKFKRIILICLLLVLAGAGIWYVQSEKRNTAFKPLEKEEIPTETGASVKSGSGLNEIGKSEFLKVPENAFGEAGAAVSEKRFLSPYLSITRSTIGTLRIPMMSMPTADCTIDCSQRLNGSKNWQTTGMSAAILYGTGIIMMICFM